jgi:hypothetical protein
MDERTRIAVEAAAFRSLVKHLQKRSDVQNIDLMILAGFCRNCLAKWYAAAAAEQGETVSYDEARTLIYGMPAAEWQTRFQREATAEQRAMFEATKPLHAEISGHR